MQVRPIFMGLFTLILGLALLLPVGLAAQESDDSAGGETATEPSASQERYREFRERARERFEQAHERLRQDREAYRQAVEQFGQDSPEAQAARRQLQQDMQQVREARERFGSRHQQQFHRRQGAGGCQPGERGRRGRGRPSQYRSN